MPTLWRPCHGGRLSTSLRHIARAGEPQLCQERDGWDRVGLVGTKPPAIISQTPVLGEAHPQQVPENYTSKDLGLAQHGTELWILKWMQLLFIWLLMHFHRVLKTTVQYGRTERYANKLDDLEMQVGPHFLWVWKSADAGTHTHLQFTWTAPFRTGVGWVLRTTEAVLDCLWPLQASRGALGLKTSANWVFCKTPKWCFFMLL